jgi:hypothetical protein
MNGNLMRVENGLTTGRSYRFERCATMVRHMSHVIIQFEMCKGANDLLLAAQAGKKR